MIKALIGVVFLASATLASSQIIPDYSVGERPFGSYHETDVDSVNLLNGDLTIKIPIVSFPQRGDLKLDFFVSTGADRPRPPLSIRGQGTSTVVTTLQYAYRPTLRWNWNGNYTFSGFMSTDDVGGPCATTEFQVYGGDAAPPPGNPDCPAPASGSVQINTLVGPLGEVHQFAGVGDQRSGPTGSKLQESIDAAGMKILAQPNVDWPTGFTDRNGTYYSLSSTQKRITDRNGNFLTSTTSGITDSAGRVIPFPATSQTLIGCPGPGDVAGASTSAKTWTIPGYSGASATYTFCYITEHLLAGYTCSALRSGNVNYNFIYSATTTSSLNAIVLPNGKMWRFVTFNGIASDGMPNNDGTVFDIVTPTGGTINYTLAPAYDPDGMVGSPCAAALNNVPGVSPRMSVQTKTINANDGTGPHTWTYTSGGSPFKTTVRDPLGNDTVHIFNPIPGAGVNLYETSTIEYQGAASSNVILKQTDTTYSGYLNPQDFTTTAMGLATKIVTTTPAGSVTVTKAYDNSGAVITGTSAIGAGNGNPTYPLVYGNLVDEKTSSVGTTATLQESVTTPLWQNSSTYLTANLLDFPASQVTKDNNGNACAETDYTYDDPAHFTTLDGSDTFVGHTAPPASVRANLSTTIRKLSNAPCTQSTLSGSSITSQTWMADLGTVEKTIDPMGAQTTYGHDSTSHTFVTSTTNPLGQTISGTYDFNTGLLSSYTDLNTRASSYGYDVLGRLKCVEFPDGGSLAFNINDSALTVDKVTRLNGSDACTSTTGNVDVQTQFDGFGRTTQTRLLSDPVSTVYTDTTYDADGRVASVSNPYRSTSESTYGVTSYAYDGLGRKTVETNPDGSKLYWCYDGQQTTAQPNCNAKLIIGTAAAWVDTQNEISNDQQILSDSLGRTIGVMESPGASQPTTPSWETDYTYNPLGLLSANQWGGTPTNHWSYVPLPRTFSYDSLGRLISSTNAEVGVSAIPNTTYSYDANGNLLQKVSPAVNIAAASANSSSTTTIGYCYDPLNRLVGKWSAAPPTGCNSTPTSVTSTLLTAYTYGATQDSTYSVGRLTDEKAYLNSTLVSEEKVTQYDQMGRVKNQTQCPFNVCGGSSPAPAYTYDYAGNVAMATSGLASQPITLTYVQDTANHLKTISSTLNSTTIYPVTLFKADSTSSSAPAYSPLGGLQNASLGVSSGSVTSLTLTRTYDNRARVLSETDKKADTTTAYNFSLTGGYASNGNVLNATDFVTGTWTYAYDSLNRITSGHATAGPNSGQYDCWGYDPFGNLTAEAYPGTCPSGATVSYNNKNQVTWVQNSAPAGFQYDAAGNVIVDNLNSYVYDAEGRICAVKNSGGGLTQYLYNAAGNRVAGGTPGSWPGSGTSATCSMSGFSPSKLYVLGLGGEQVSELNGSGAWQHTNVFRGGTLLATYRSTQTYFSLNDWLGTKRVEFGSNTLCSSATFSLAFGNAQSTSGNCPLDAAEQHFTGKERDAESGNDYFPARYYQSPIGRWLSPDIVGGNIVKPQSLNRYSYVLNNPLSFVDAYGFEATESGNCHPAWACVVSNFFKHLFRGGSGSGGPALPPAGNPIGRSTHRILPFAIPVVHAQAVEPDVDPEVDAKEDELDPRANDPLEPLAPGESVWRPINAFRPGRGPLNPEDAKNFDWYIPVKLSEPLPVWRYSGRPAFPSGRYFSLFKPEGPVEFIRDQLAILPKWNSMKDLNEVTIPAGQTVYIGPASAQPGYSGGGFQVFSPTPYP